MKLVVVESPAKVKTISKYLGSGYEVKASYGHIADLPKSELGVDVDKKFEPKYVVSNRKALSGLKASFKGKNSLVLAVDPDREGEAIGWHVAQRLGVIRPDGKVKRGKTLERIVFTSITKEAIEEAIKNPRGIDFDLVNAQQARRVLDRLVGYKLSPLLWKKIRFGLSAGRVQSAALRLIVEREEDRNKFKAQEYWTLVALLSKVESKGKAVLNIIKKESKSSDEQTPAIKAEKNEIPFELVYKDGKKFELKKESDVKKVTDEIKNLDWFISKIEAKQTKRYPKPPFTTSTLQQTASYWLNFPAKKTMRTAQKLYENGLITYMRTDSTNLTPSAVNEIRKKISSEYGNDFVSEKPIFYKTKAKVAQEAHEAIRPTQASKSPSDMKLALDELKLYRLIWQRTLACQMKPASIENGSILIEIDKYTFISRGQRILFKGYLSAYPEKVSENILPEVKEGDKLFPNSLNGIQHFTQPPARFSEATLIKALESYGIGRPSTYVPIITTILARGYSEKEGKYFVPTDTGIVVVRFLKENFSDIVDYEFTAKMENSLDNIANGELNWVSELSEFFGPFEKNILQKEKKVDREDYTVLGSAPKKIKCPICKGPMNIKLGRYGKFYSCQKWPKCKGILSFENKQEDLVKFVKDEKFTQKYESSPKTEDNRDYVLKSGRFGKFWAHPDYPKVKDAKPLLLKEKCPECKSNLVERKGKGGRFFIGCSGYPKCKYIRN